MGRERVAAHDSPSTRSSRFRFTDPMAERDSVAIGHGGALTLSRGQWGPGELGGDALWSLRVRLANEGLVAESYVLLGPEGVEESLAEFFDGMAGSWRGWVGSKEWVGMEGG